MNRVLCNSTIDPNEDGGFDVTVVGVGEYSGVTRVYKIDETDETSAAMEGIRRFSEEFGG